MIRLLDINVLVALAWPTHSCHEAAHGWFERHRGEGWASCSATQSGFVRICCSRKVVTEAMTPVEAIAAMERSAGQPEHQFWPMHDQVGAMEPEMMVRIMGPGQMSDAVLLDLAIKRGGLLSTFDRKIQHLLPRASRLSAHLEVIPT